MENIIVFLYPQVCLKLQIVRSGTTHFPLEFALLHVPVTAALLKDIPFALSLELPVSIK